MIICTSEIADLSEAVDVWKFWTVKYPNNGYQFRFNMRDGTWQIVRPMKKSIYDV